MQRGEVRWYRFTHPDKRRPIVILTRNSVISYLGMGRLTVTAIFNREYHVVQGAVLIGVVFVIVVNLLVDIAYAFLNPKIRY